MNTQNKRSGEFSWLLGALPAQHCCFTQAHGVSRPLLAASIFRANKPVIVVTKEHKSLDSWVKDLRSLIPEREIFRFPNWESLPFEPVSPQVFISADRLRSAIALNRQSPCVVVTTPSALLLKTLPPDMLSELVFSLRSGDKVDREEFVYRLDVCGYRRTSLVEESGDYAIRGRVVDVFSPTQAFPVRFEFCDDIIERVRSFDSSSQRSLRELESCEVTPVREYLPLGGDPNHSEAVAKTIAKIKQRSAELEVPPREIATIISAVRNAGDTPGIELTQPYVLSGMRSIFEHISGDPIILFDGTSDIFETMEKYSAMIAERAAACHLNHQFAPRSEELYLTNSELIEQLRRFEHHSLETLKVEAKTGGEGALADTTPLYIDIAAKPNTELSALLNAKRKLGQHFPTLAMKLSEWADRGFSIVMMIGSEARAKRLAEHLLECDLKIPIRQVALLDWMGSANPEPMSISHGQISQGAIFPHERRIILSEQELFGERSYRKSSIQPKSIKRLLSSLSQLKEGDHVVHVDYGIGIYRGLKPVMIEDEGTELLQIEYLDSTLYLPVHNISKVQKFSAAEGQAPQLDKLSSTRWKKVKLKVQKDVIELAGDLINLYAARDIAKGWRFDPYGALDEQFAEEFAYNETEDQLKAIMETLEDMSKETPMDRLICGDVGFGKTEIALRAAYKSVQHARQVAILAPTTILVEQHKETFEKRLADYPVKVGAVSRFYKPKENQAVLQKVASGDIDIIIGTHRLLSKDVLFKELGLLIIDEEHRFGVKQKEKIKQIKKEVDVLTLTATPIPRTLHMSLLDIRDISLISTPPVDRRVIQSHIVMSEEGVIHDAILREIERGGQCFFVHNRVQGIDLMTAELSELVPEARFRYAHGQMSEKELEKIMWDFIHHEFDVLVCTTIVESGIDIPNANTILINRADAFGLAQLYQLRGRVGRSSRQAYCYFMIPKKGKLGRDAKKRLEALQGLDDLGQGFNLAVRDLEIRGAGNLLGKEQSGNVLSVGFELYSKILGEAVAHIRGQTPDLFESIDPEVKIDANAYIPEDYIPDVSERLILYQRFSSLRSDEEGRELLEEIDDRFGPPPLQVDNLLRLMCFRSFLRRHGVVRAELNRSKVSISFSPHAPVNVDRLIEFVNRNHQKYKLSKSLSLSISDPQPSHEELNTEVLYNKVQKVLLHLSEKEERA